MTAAYPDLLAAGVTDLGRFDQFDLFAGEKDIVTDQYQAADATAIPQFAVLTLDASGKAILFTGSALYSTGYVAFTANPTADTDTVTINGHAITYKASGATANQVNLGADANATIDNLVTVINALPATYAVSAEADHTASRLYLTSLAAGAAGNSIALAESSTATTVSGGTLSDVDAIEGVPSGQAVAIAAQAVPSTTPGAYLPVFVGGIFNHEALVWPDGIGTLTERKAAFAGSQIGVRQLL